MDNRERIVSLRLELYEELTQNILPYWIKLRDNQYGGYYGRVTGKEELDKEAPKGAVLQSRILWTFSAAARILRNKKYLDYAANAKDFILEKMYDKTCGGIFWSVDHKGNIADPRKQFYALGFTLRIK